MQMTDLVNVKKLIQLNESNGIEKEIDRSDRWWIAT